MTLATISIVAATMLATVNIHTSRIGDGTFTFGDDAGYYKGSLSQSDIALESADTNLTAKSGAVVYSAAEGWADRMIAQKVCDGEYAASVLETYADSTIAFGMPSNRTFNSAHPGIKLSISDYNAMQQSIAGYFQQEQERRGTQEYIYEPTSSTRQIACFYNPQDFCWCLPSATGIGTKPWADVDSLTFDATTWATVDSMPYSYGTDPGGEYVPHYSYTKLNDWLRDLNGYNYRVQPIPYWNQQDLQKSYLQYTRDSFGDYLIPTNCVMSNALDRATLARDWRLGIPLFAKTWVKPGSLSVNVGHEIVTLYSKRETSGTNVGSPTTMYIGARKTMSCPSFNDNTIVWTNWDVCAEFAITNRYEGSSMVAAIGNGYQACYNAEIVYGDAIFKVRLYEAPRGNWNAIWLDPSSSEDNEGVTYAKYCNFDVSSKTVVDISESDSSDILDGYFHRLENAVKTLNAYVYRGVDMIRPAIISSNAVECSFPSAAATRIGCVATAECMSLKNEMGYVEDVMESDPAARGGIIYASTFGIAKDSVIGSNSVSYARTCETELSSRTGGVDAVMQVLKDNRTSLLQDLSQARGGYSAASLVPLDSEDLLKTKNQAMSVSFGKKMSNWKFGNHDFLLSHLVLMVEEDEQARKFVIKGAYALCTTNGLWKSVGYTETSNDNYDINLGYHIFGCGGWGYKTAEGTSEVGPPEFSWEDEPKWWHGCCINLFGLWVQWAWDNYIYTESEE